MSKLQVAVYFNQHGINQAESAFLTVAESAFLTVAESGIVAYSKPLKFRGLSDKPASPLPWNVGDEQIYDANGNSILGVDEDGIPIGFPNEWDADYIVQAVEMFNTRSMTGPTQDYIDLFEAAKDAIDEWPASSNTDNPKFEKAMALLESVVVALDEMKKICDHVWTVKATISGIAEPGSCQKCGEGYISQLTKGR